MPAASRPNIRIRISFDPIMRVQTLLKSKPISTTALSTRHRGEWWPGMLYRLVKLDPESTRDTRSWHGGPESYGNRTTPPGDVMSFELLGGLVPAAKCEQRHSPPLHAQSTTVCTLRPLWRKGTISGITGATLTAGSEAAKALKIVYASCTKLSFQVSSHSEATGCCTVTSSIGHGKASPSLHTGHPLSGLRSPV